jgi:hypothetical protein
MIRTLFLCTALVAISSSAWAADAAVDTAPRGISGYGEFYAGYGWGSDNDPQDWEYSVLGGSGRVNIWLTDSFSAQLDGWINDYDSDGYDYDSLGAALHLNTRNSDYLIGGLASYGSNGDYDGDFVSAALEAQRYFDNVTIYGQAGYTAQVSGDTSPESADAWYIHAAARYFFNPDLMIEANAGFALVDAFDDEDSQSKWGARLSWKPSENLPVGVFVGYQGLNDDWREGYELTDHTLFAGFNLYFGQGTLLANDREGATLVDYNPMFGVNEPWDSY